MSESKDDLFKDIPPFPQYLRELRALAVKTVVDPTHLGSVKCALDVAFGTLLAELKAPIPSARWVLEEYVGYYDSEKKDLIEHIRPAKFTVDQYWDQVNG